MARNLIIVAFLGLSFSAFGVNVNPANGLDVAANFQLMAAVMNKSKLTVEDVKHVQSLARFPEDLAFFQSLKAGQPFFRQKKLKVTAAAHSVFFGF